MMRQCIFGVVTAMLFIVAGCSGSSSTPEPAVEQETRTIVGLIVLVSDSPISDCSEIMRVIATATDSTTVIDDSVEDCSVQLELTEGNDYVISFVNSDGEFIATLVADYGSVIQIEGGTTVIDLGNITIEEGRATFSGEYLDYIDSDDDGVVDSADETPCGDQECSSLYSCEYFGFSDSDDDDICDQWDTIDDSLEEEAEEEVASDYDADGIIDDNDNCPMTANADQADADSDGTGDSCDTDSDGDGVVNASDNCPSTANADQLDTDSDDDGNECDTDDDGDSALDVDDNCVLISNASQVDTDSDGSGDECDADDDNDAVADASDNCPKASNASQTDTDDDGDGDACDTDDDGDGVLDDADVCQYIVNADQADNDEDGFGDVCDTDDDNDGDLDVDDNCPMVSNADQLDTDDDGDGNACDTDDDADGILDVDDNCSLVANADQADNDSDDSGDVCDTDDDNDGDLDVDDNCPMTANADQADGDDDGYGDVCDLGSELDILYASDAEANDKFGRSTAISDSYAVVGAHGAGGAPIYHGAVYVFDMDDEDYSQLSILTASDATNSSFLGGSVGISGDYIVVGAYGKNTNTGAAYIFEKGEAWSESQTETKAMTASDGEEGDWFGLASAISGNYAIVGSYWDHHSDCSNVGSAYIYERTDGSWPATETQKLIPSNPTNSDNFGSGVSISGNYAVVGSPGEDTKASAAGAAYVFKRVAGTWTESIMLTADDGEIGDGLGAAVAISGNYLVVGASGEDDMGSAAGAAYVFELVGDTWTQVEKLTASDGQASDSFGTAVAISGDRIVVGAVYEDGGDGDPASNSGSAYVYFRNEDGDWNQVEKITASDAQADDYYGYAVAISPSFVLVGANSEDTGGSKAGAAYIY